MSKELKIIVFLKSGESFSPDSVPVNDLVNSDSNDATLDKVEELLNEPRSWCSGATGVLEAKIGSHVVYVQYENIDYVLCENANYVLKLIEQYRSERFTCY